jgi:hypothetical protein
MLLSINPWWDVWELYHKVTFDGENRLIIVNPDVTELDVKIDIYSDWKEWIQTYDYAKFPPAIRTTGGDPIGGGEFTGDVYFLINDWRLLIGQSLNIDGVIYSDDYPSPFVQVSGTQIVTNKVSSLVQTVTTGGSGVAPTAQENADAVWEKSIAVTQPGTTGEKLKQGLTTGNFLGLK